MKSISTHVLDQTRGRPAKGVRVVLTGEDGSIVRDATTDDDGRVKDLVPEGKLTAGTYRLRFDVGAYFAAQNMETFYPEATIVFTVRDANAHYHVPLLLSPFGYSTYRGS
ncbi:MAG TPA: hydroxyisourate hydrolase [Labilithrix sp.]|jgi:5-hydroxyisourate hydrolase